VGRLLLLLLLLGNGPLLIVMLRLPLLLVHSRVRRRHA
jgi:hypothetical protein